MIEPSAAGAAGRGAWRDGRRARGPHLRLRRRDAGRRGRLLISQARADRRHPARQYRCLSSGSAAAGLKAAGLPVPGIRWASPDEDLLGAPFIVMERLPAGCSWSGSRTLVFTRPSALRDIWLQAAQVLARLQRVDWRTTLAGWEAPQPLHGEVARWAHVLRHAQEPDWLSAGTRLGELLAANLPDEDPVGLIHGDFQARQHFCTRTAAPAASSTGSCPPSARRASTSAALDDVRSAGVASGWRPVAPVTAGTWWRAIAMPQARRFESRMASALAHYRLGSIACLM